jgi:hypothetical protein
MGRDGRRLEIVSNNAMMDAMGQAGHTSAVIGDLVACRSALQAVLGGLVERIHVGNLVVCWELKRYVRSVDPETRLRL